MIEIVPTVVPTSFDDIKVFVARDGAFSQAFHIDASDGVFAPNTTWIPQGEEKLPDADRFFYEAHLMLADPEATGNAFAVAGAKRIIVHVETLVSETETKRIFESWKNSGAREIGLAILTGTPLEAIDPYIFLCDTVTVMSVASIGKQGAPFDERALGRITDLHARYSELVIEADGGIRGQQIAALVRAGVSRFSIGSVLAGSDDPAQTHKELLELASAAVYSTV